LLVPGLKNPIKSATLLANHKKLKVQSNPEGIEIAVPAEAPDAISSTVVLAIKGTPQVQDAVLGQSAADGSLQLPASEAQPHGEQIRYESGDNRDCIGFWTDPKDWVEWKFKITRPGRYRVSAQIAALGTGSFVVTFGGQKLEGTAPNTLDYGKFEQVQLGTLELVNRGMASLSVKAVADGWQPLNLRSINLTAVP
jgi:hypothetical protein